MTNEHVLASTDGSPGLGMNPDPEPVPEVANGGGDVTDWVNQGHTGDELVELATSAPEWSAGNDADRQHWESTEPFSLKSLTD